MLLCAWCAANLSVAIWAYMRSAPRPMPTRDNARAVILRPCAGADAWLARTAASTPGARFLIATNDDAAGALVPAAIVTGARAANRKADQLRRALEVETSDYDVVIVADSDVVVSPEQLACLAASSADATWTAPVEIEPKTGADHASARILDASLHAFSLLAGIDASGMVGKLFAIRREALEDIGGFAALTDRLGEDMEIARRLRDSGRSVRRADAPASSLASGRSWSEVIARYARWIQVIKAQRPALLVSYPLLFAATPIQLVLAIAAPATIPLILLSRYLIAIMARHRSKQPLLSQPYLGDVILLVAWLRALTTRTVRWRGHTLKLAHGRVSHASIDSASEPPC